MKFKKSISHCHFWQGHAHSALIRSSPKVVLGQPIPINYNCKIVKNWPNTSLAVQRF